MADDVIGPEELLPIRIDNTRQDGPIVQDTQSLGHRRDKLEITLESGG